MKSNEGTVTSLKDSVTDLQGTHKPALIQGCNARKVNCSCVYSAYILKPVLCVRNL